MGWVLIVFSRSRFMDCEKWRKEFGADDLVRTFNYVEKPEVFKYYPQFYHKTDKVCLLVLGWPGPETNM